MKIFTTVGNAMVHSRHFRLGFLPVLRTLLFPRRSALQPFQLALQRLEKLRALLERAIRSGQKSLQAKVNSDRPTLNRSIGNRHTRFDRDDDVPLRTPHPRHHSHLLHLEPVRDRAMQVDRDFTDLWQLDSVAAEWLIGGNDVFLLQRASVYQTLTRSNPVFEFAQSVVIYASARLKPRPHFSLLCGIWMDSVGVVHCQHGVIPPQLEHSGKCLLRGHRTPLSKRRDSMYPDADAMHTARDLCSRALRS